MWYNGFMNKNERITNVVTSPRKRRMLLSDDAHRAARLIAAWNNETLQDLLDRLVLAEMDRLHIQAEKPTRRSAAGKPALKTK